MNIRDFLTIPFRKKVVEEENSGESLVSVTGLHLSQEDRMRRIVRSEMLRQMTNSRAETFEESDDFDLDDGEEWVSGYEESFDPPSVTTEPVAKLVPTPPPASEPSSPPPGGAD